MGGEEGEGEGRTKDGHGDGRRRKKKDLTSPRYHGLMTCPIMLLFPVCDATIHEDV